ncbi:MAG: hypothetical protein HQ515_21715, partial [Phycisphaeraceae bacterium]|nr:hypothetical protein [Phycisphaeraceae bacterium]
MVKPKSELGARKRLRTARLAEAVMLLCVCLLIVHTVLLSHGGALLKYLVSKVVTKPREILNIDLENCDLQGAELHVNGVKLGALPLAIDQVEFVNKVPVWDDQPAPLNRSEIPELLREYRPSGGFNARVYSHFNPIRVGRKSPLSALKRAMSSSGKDGEGRGGRQNAKESGKAGSISQTGPGKSRLDTEEQTYYAQVKYQGQWCYATGSSSGGGLNREIHVGLEFICPAYEHRLEQLLDIARVKDYQVSEDWFEALDTFGHDGVLALLKAERDEPPMKDLLDHWASRRFGLNLVENEATAWQAFQRICETATKAKAYSTEGLEGRAVVLLAPKLSVKQLTRQAIGLVKSTSGLGGKMEWRARGKTHFGVSYEGARFVCSLGRSFHYMDKSADSPPVSGYAVAHALWFLFEQGDSKVTDAFQNHIVPEMIAKYYPNIPWYPFVSAMGGRALECCLLRQDWETELKQVPSAQNMGRLDTNFERWLILCAQLQTEAGEQFRRMHCDKLLQVADQVYTRVRFGELEFLFSNLDQGTDSLAFQYWPRFLKRVLEKWRGLMLAEVLFGYLLEMEPLSEPQMYVDVFHGMTRQHDLEMGLKKLSLLLPSKRQVVCDALKGAVSQDVSHLKRRTRSSEDEVQNQLLSVLEELLVSDQEKVRKLYENLAEKRSSGSQAKWLSQLSEDHPVVPMLAHSDRSDLRRLALYAIESHPSA